VPSARAFVDAHYAVTGPPVGHAIMKRRAAQLASGGSAAPSPGPIPPIFERFTAQARGAIKAGVQYSRRADDPCVEPGHLLSGVLAAKAGAAAAVRTRYGWPSPPPQPSYPEATGRYCREGERPSVLIHTEPRDSRATGIFSAAARRIVAEDVLIIAERLGHRAVTTGHVLIAVLERADEATSEIISPLPDVREVAAAVTDALPGEEDT